jgi:oligopeptide transport system ATP-binding protein
MPERGPLLLEARDLQVAYPQAPRLWRTPPAPVVLHNVSLQIDRGQSLAIVGESGSGKSTLARALLRLLPLLAGQVLLRGEDLAVLTAEELRQRRRDMQLVFQDPLASLDPRMTVERILLQPLLAFEPALPAAQRQARMVEQLEQVGLTAAHLARYPQQLSGGQAQRVGIARALLAQPAVLVCDEPVAALDLVTRAQVLELLAGLQRSRQLAIVFISHDLAAVHRLCQRTLVLYRGRVVEQGETADLLRAPREAYTRQLLESVLVADPRRARRR